MPMQPEVFFLPADDPLGGQRFCLYYPAEGGANGAKARGLVLYIHPLAEEMNKSRRMAALQARALAQAGYAVLQIDLLGCGDSAGDFGDATWQHWVDDVVRGWRWLRHRHVGTDQGADAAPLWLWGLRAGCLLAVAAASQLGEHCHFLFWQPPASGKPLLQQFLRLKLAGDMLSGLPKGAMAAMREQLASGSAIEIGGYSLSPGMATALEQAMLAPMVGAGPGRRLEWFELSTQENASLSPISTQTIARWAQAGVQVGHHLVQGPAFWQTTEIEEAPRLIAATVAALAV